MLIGQKEIDLSHMGTVQSFLLQEDAERAPVHLSLLVDKKVIPLHSGLRNWERDIPGSGRRCYFNFVMFQAAARRN